MSSNKKGLLRTVFTSNGSCGCGKTKAFEVHEPIPIPKISIHKKTNLMTMASSTTTSGEHNNGNDEDFTFTSTTTISEAETSHHDHNKSPKNSNVVQKRSPLMDSTAFVKDSADPYHDFKHSMLQMIFEKEIDSEDDLQDLLQCFLHLNSLCHHHVIVKAFNDICEEAFPDKVSTTPSATTEPSPSPSPSHRNQNIDHHSKESVNMPMDPS